MCLSKSTAIDLLTLHRSLYLDELRDSIPKPKGTVPDFGLPRWRTMPLESKMPKIPGLQENVYVLSRRSLGQSLWLSSPDHKRFDTSDPYNNEIQLPYDGLHDRHLTRFFLDSKNVRDIIIKAGLVTPRLEVKCNLKEYNAYRSYLRMMHGKAVRLELERRDEIYKERMMLEIADRQAVKKRDSLKKDEIRTNNYNEIQLQKATRIEELRKKQKEDIEKVRALNHLKKQILQKKIVERRIKTDHYKQKRAIMLKREQQIVLNTLKEWHERDHRLQKFKEKKLLTSKDLKIKNSLKRFDEKTKAQEEAIAREAFVKNCAEQIKKSFICRYETKMAESRKKLHELFLKKRKALEKSFRLKKKPKKRSSCRCKLD